MFEDLDGLNPIDPAARIALNVDEPATLWPQWKIDATNAAHDSTHPVFSCLTYDSAKAETLNIPVTHLDGRILLKQEADGQWIIPPDSPLHDRYDIKEKAQEK